MAPQQRITEAGQPCRHCQVPVVRVEGRKRVRKGRAYFFEWFFQCPSCRAMYMVEAAKRLAGEVLMEVQDNLSTALLAHVADELGYVVPKKVRPARKAKKHKPPHVPFVRPDYYEYIRSPAWRQRAEAAKVRAGHRCQICNRHRQEVVLDAHHRTYQRLGREKPEDITVLCRGCHEIYEKHKKHPGPA
jgi:5-methylcytosine-specific restriction endonuclease McrA